MAATLALIKKVGPDVLGVQEANIKWYNYLVANLTGYGVTGFGRESTGANCENATATTNDGEGCYIFYRKDTFKDPTVKKTYWLSSTPTVKSNGYTGVTTDAYNRTVNFAVLERKADNKQMLFCSTHYDLQAADQVKESEQIVGYLTPYIQANTPVVMVGDLNTTSGSNSFNVLKNAGLRNSYVYAEEVGEVCATHDGGSVIDFILCSDDMGVPFYTVVTDATNPSDHRPIYAWVKY